MGKCPQVRIIELEEENAKLLGVLSDYTSSRKSLIHWHINHLELEPSCPYCAIDQLMNKNAKLRDKVEWHELQSWRFLSLTGGGVS